MKSQAQLEFPQFKGEALTQLPDDLFIPPEALEIYLKDFSGPMDVLLYLIQKKDINILDLDISEITDQYIQYIELMDALKIELAADYLVMAATLAQIKSRMLIPCSTSLDLIMISGRPEPIPLPSNVSLAVFAAFFEAVSP